MNNFTILKKEIRQKYLTIDNDEVTEIDINNSQPLFLSLLLKNEMDENDPENAPNMLSYLLREDVIFDLRPEKLSGVDFIQLTKRIGHGNISN